MALKCLLFHPNHEYINNASGYVGRHKGSYNMPGHYLAQVSLLERVANILEGSDEKTQLLSNIAQHRQNAPAMQDMLHNRNSFQHANNKSLINTFNQQINSTFERVANCIETMLTDKSASAKSAFIDTFKRDCAPTDQKEMKAFNHFLEGLATRLGVEQEAAHSPSPQKP